MQAVFEAVGRLIALAPGEQQLRLAALLGSLANAPVDETAECTRLACDLAQTCPAGAARTLAIDLAERLCRLATAGDHKPANHTLYQRTARDFAASVVPQAGAPPGCIAAGTAARSIVYRLTRCRTAVQQVGDVTSGTACVCVPKVYAAQKNDWPDPQVKAIAMLAGRAHPRHVILVFAVDKADEHVAAVQKWIADAEACLLGMADAEPNSFLFDRVAVRVSAVNAAEMREFNTGHNLVRANPAYLGDALGDLVATTQMRARADDAPAAKRVRL